MSRYTRNPPAREYIRNVLTGLTDDMSKPWNSYPCLPWERGLNSNGYGRLWEDGHEVMAHRFAYILTFGALGDDQIACHHCDNPKCFRPIHLFAGSHADNHLDMLQKGRENREPKPASRGEGNVKAVLTAGEVLDIRRCATEMSQQELADRFRVSKSAIKHILHRRSWAHI